MTQGDGETGRFGGCSEAVIGACIEVHRHLGPGLFESAYEECVAHELMLRGLRFERQQSVPLEYKGMMLECGYRLDLVVENILIVEIKSVDKLLPIHQAQLLTYLRLTNLQTGLLVNFRETVLKNGLRRLTLSKKLPVSPSPCETHPRSDEQPQPQDLTARTPKTPGLDEPNPR
jgi:GxxExxY protein